MQGVVKFGLTALTLWLGVGGAIGATINRVDGSSSPAIFTLEGPIEESDGDRFVDQAIGVDLAIVVLSSEGGSVSAAIKIGQAIRLKGFGTLVPDGTVCASACGLIWLAGQPRYMAPTAQIGFHAAYDLSDGTPRERGAPNALVGAYLGALGLSQRAIFYLTTPSPDQMQWLTFADAPAIGVDVQRFEIPSGPSGGPIEERPATPGLSKPQMESADSGDVPQFRDYPSGRTQLTNRAPVDLSSRDAWTFRTRLRNAAKQEPNFADKFVIASWGCGTTCVTGAAVDLSSGHVTFLPATVCCWGNVDANFNALEFRQHSRLLVMSGLLNEEGAMGAHFFLFDGTSFKLLTMIETSSDFGASLGKRRNQFSKQ